MKFTYTPNWLARKQIYYEPDAKAVIEGSKDYPTLNGEVLFYQLHDSVLIIASVGHLPKTENGFFAFHLHDGESCTGNIKDEFSNAGVHFNPSDFPHPKHAGDFPPLIASGGNAYLSFVTDRFNVNEIIGKTIIIHYNPDDFKTQPSGDAGTKIACAVIVKA